MVRGMRKAPAGIWAIQYLKRYCPLNKIEGLSIVRAQPEVKPVNSRNEGRELDANLDNITFQTLPQ